MDFLSLGGKVFIKNAGMTAKKVARIILLAVLLPAAMIMLNQGGYISAVTPSVEINVTPKAITEYQGEQFTITIKTSTVTSLNKYTLDLVYDPAVLEVYGEEGGSGVTNGSIKDSTVNPAVTTPIPVTWSYSTQGIPGKISIEGNLGAGVGVNGSGYLAKVTFVMIGAYGETSEIIPENIQLRQTMGAYLTVSSVVDADATVRYPPVDITIETPDTILAGEAFTAHINISIIEAISAFQFDLTYNPDTLQINDYEGGYYGVTDGMIGGTPLPVEVWVYHPIGSPGTIRVLGSTYTGEPILDGSGYLCEINFMVVGEGGSRSNLEFTETDSFKPKLFNYLMELGYTVEVGDVIWHNSSVDIISLYRIKNRSPLPPGEIGIPYSETLQAAGGITPYTFSIESGSLPDGLELDPGGEISGTPSTVGGPNSVTFKVRDATGEIAVKTLLISIADNPSVISASPLEYGEVNLPYSDTLQVSGGVAPYTWSLASGSIPSGMTLSTGGVLSGTTTTSGNYTFTTRVIDSLGGTATKTLVLVIAPAPSIATTSPLPNGEVNIAYSQTLSGTGGVPNYTYSLFSGSLPAGLVLSPAGTISGTPTLAGTSVFSVKITDCLGGASVKQIILTIVSAPSIITASPLTQGEVNAAYSKSLAVTGGISPYNWTLVSGSLPAGLTLSTAGVISGTPSVAGTSSFNVKVTDSKGASANKTFNLSIIAGLNITTVSPLPEGEVSVDYYQALNVTGGSPAYTWTLQSGSLPAGLTMTTGGVISGRPISAGTSNFVVEVSDPLGGKAIKIFSINIVAGPSITTDSPLPDGEKKITYSCTLSVTGGFPNYTWSKISGSLPYGTNLNSAGIISGYPYISGVYTFTVQVKDSKGGTHTRQFILTIRDAPYFITASPLPRGEVNMGYSQTLLATSGVPPYTFSRYSGTIPPGLSLGTDGVLSGTPTAAGTYTFTARVTDSLGGTGNSGFEVNTITAPDITTTSPLPDCGVDVAYNQALAATGGVAPYTWSLYSGTLPEGLNLSTAGVISGTPVTTGTSIFNVMVRDSLGGTDIQLFSLTVVTGMSITTASPLPKGEKSISYSQLLTVSGGAAPYTWTIISGTLPSGLNMSTAGLISGRPNTAGTYIFTVKTTDSLGLFTTRQFTLVIADTPTFVTTSPLMQGEVDLQYSQTLVATEGVPPYTFSKNSGTIPPGLTLGTNGVLNGTPTAAGNYTFLAKVEDSCGGAGTRSFATSIADKPQITTGTPLPSGGVDVIYNQALAATGGTGAYAWSLLSGTLPEGLYLNTAGVISGTPTSIGASSFTVILEDSLGGTDTQQYTLDIVEGMTITTGSPLTEGEKNVNYSQTLGVIGGAAPYTWTKISGTLPPGLNLNAAGQISGKPTSAGTYTFTAQVSDSLGLNNARLYTLHIADTPSFVTTSPLMQGEVDLQYSQTLVATEGVPPYTFSKYSGTIPPGLTLGLNGVLNGTPTSTGNYTFIAKVTDSYGGAGTRTFVTSIADKPQITTGTPLPSGGVGIAYNKALAATGGAGAYTWSLYSGSLPDGLNISTAGVISGTPVTTGTSLFTIKLRDSLGGTDTCKYTLPIVSGLTITTSSPLPDGEKYVNYSQALGAIGGAEPYTWAKTSGTLPPGLNLSAAGQITGRPTSTGTYTFGVHVADSLGLDTTGQFALHIADEPSFVTTSPLMQGEVDLQYSQTLIATEGVPPYTFSKYYGTIPPGLTLGTNGVLNGTPTTAGNYTFIAKVEDTYGESDTRTFAASIADKPQITTGTPLPSGGVNIAYNQALAATGGTGAYTWSLLSGTLPEGLYLSMAGVISGTPTSIGASNFTVMLEDSLGGTDTQQYTLDVVVGLTITTSSPLTEGERNVNYSQTLGVIGGVAPYTWTKISGTLPPGLNLNTAGQISGKPTSAGTYTFTAQVADSLGLNNARLYTLHIADTPSFVTISPLMQGEVDLQYSQTLVATEGVPPYTFSKYSGIIPPGLTLGANGVLNGTPTNAGNYTFIAKVADSYGGAGTRTFVTSIADKPQITTGTPLPSISVGMAYNQALAATGGAGTYTWSLYSGSLPDGLNISTAGVISGTPVTTGTSLFTIKLRDSLGGMDTQQYTLDVVEGLTITTSSPLPDGEKNVLYSQNLGVSGGIPGYTWARISGTLPSGTSLSTAGRLSGRPTSTGTFTFTVQVTDSQGAAAARIFNLTIKDEPEITTVSPIVNGEVGAEYWQTLQVTEGVSPYTWTMAAGTMPPGLDLNTNGIISGTAATAGTYTFTVKATDSLEKYDTRVLVITVINGMTIITPNVLNTGEVGLHYSLTLLVNGGAAAYTWTLESGDMPTALVMEDETIDIGISEDVLPDGMSLSPDGVISGIPQVAGTSQLNVQVTDSLGGKASRQFTLTIEESPSINITSPLNSGGVNQPYSVALSVSGGVAPYTWTRTSGNLPPGMDLDENGTLHGTPSAAGTYVFSATVTDSLGGTDEREFTLEIVTPPSIVTATPLTGGEVNVPYSKLMAVTGGISPYTWTLTGGSLPPGLTLSTAGLISGTPQAAGNSTFTVTVTDSQGVGSSKEFSLNIIPAPSVATASPLPIGSVDIEYYLTLEASGGIGDYTWTLRSGTLPSGLTLSTAGVLSGIPASKGSYSFSVWVTDALGGSGFGSFNLTVVDYVSITTASTLPQGEVDHGYSTSLAVSGGLSPYEWTLKSGSLPDGLYIGSGGAISGTPSTSGTSSFTLMVTDSLGGTDEKLFSLTIQEKLLITSTSPMVNGEVNIAYSVVLAASGGLSPYTWSVQSGSLPDNLVLSSTGIISGTPSSASNATFEIRLTDRLGAVAVKEFSITIIAAPAITTASPAPAGLEDVYYSLNMAVSGGTGPYTWSASGLPEGLTMSHEGVISGIPTQTGNHDVIVTVKDSFIPSNSDSKTIALYISGELYITKNALDAGLQGKTYSQPLSAEGGIQPYTWNAENLPAGLTIDSNSGIISGIPLDYGVYTVNITVTSSQNPGIYTSKELTLKIYMIYDANGNELVDMGDVVKVQRIYSGLDAETPAADANGDGVVGVNDILVIIRYILGLDV